MTFVVKFSDIFHFSILLLYVFHILFNRLFPTKSIVCNLTDKIYICQNKKPLTFFFKANGWICMEEEAQVGIFLHIHENIYDIHTYIVYKMIIYTY